ncbi:MAG: hypothetical protein UFG06_13935 [Lachnospiraceae bacterium]|nr:hypothetical protein [Lachnospiraceae bacterium]
MYIVNGQNKEFETYRVNEQIKELETWRDMISNGEQSKCDVRSEIDVINDAINTIQTLSTRIQEKNVLKTNADRIRSMTDEELADNIMCPNETGLAEIKCIKSDSCNCYDCCLKFLQSEREEV